MRDFPKCMRGVLSETTSASLQHLKTGRPVQLKDLCKYNNRILGTLANEKACTLHNSTCLKLSRRERLRTYHKRMLETLSRRKACVFTTSACMINTFERRSCAPFRHDWQTRPAGRSDALQHCKLKRALTEAHFLRQSWLSTSSTFQTGTEPYLVKYDKVIALRLDRGRRHAEPIGALGQSLKRASGGVPQVFPMLSSAARPNPFQPMNMTYRRDVGQWSSGWCLPRPFRGSPPN